MDPDVDSERKQSLLRRVLASPPFLKSQKLSAFLAYICEQDRLGLSGEINEQRIGVAVFGRADGYHVGEDSIVRSQARLLRQKLEEYFEKHGAEETLILSMPKGSYQPVFAARADVSTPESAEASLHEVAGTESEDFAALSTQPNFWRSILQPLSVVALLMLLSASGYWLWSHLRDSRAQAGATIEGRFWNTIFDGHRNTIIVPSDSSLVLLQEISGRQIPLRDYMNRSYLDEKMNPPMDLVWHKIAASQYTNLADLNLLSRLDEKSLALNTHPQVRYARDLALTELKENNAILIGGKRSNPWVELFMPRTRLQVDYDQQTRRNFVWNREPRNGEQERYYELGEETFHPAYGVIAYLPSLDGQGATLLVGGTSKAGTEAASEFLFSGGFSSFLRGFSSDSLPPHFEILVATQNINGDSHNSKIVFFHRLDDK